MIMDLKKIIRKSVKDYKKNWKKLLLTGLYINIVIMLFALLHQQMNGSVFLILNILVGCIFKIFDIGMDFIALEIVRSRKISLKDGLAKGFGTRGIDIIAMEILIKLYTFLWALLFIIPGIERLMAYSQSYFIFLNNPEINIKKCMNDSKSLMKENKTDYFYLSMILIIFPYITIMIIFKLFTDMGGSALLYIQSIPFWVLNIIIYPLYKVIYSNFYIYLADGEENFIDTTDAKETSHTYGFIIFILLITGISIFTYGLGEWKWKNTRNTYISEKYDEMGFPKKNLGKEQGEIVLEQEEFEKYIKDNEIIDPESGNPVTGTITVHDKDDGLKKIFQIKDGYFKGEQIFYYENGNKAIVVNYDGGSISGKFTLYNPEGDEIYNEDFGNNGSGVFIMLYPNNKIMSLAVYEHGYVQSSCGYSKDGTLLNYNILKRDMEKGMRFLLNEYYSKDKKIRFISKIYDDGEEQHFYYDEHGNFVNGKIIINGSVTQEIQKGKEYKGREGSEECSKVIKEKLPKYL